MRLAMNGFNRRRFYFVLERGEAGYKVVAWYRV